MRNDSAYERGTLRNPTWGEIFPSLAARSPFNFFFPSSSRFSLTRIVKAVHVTFPDECTISLSLYVSPPFPPFFTNRHHPTFLSISPA